MLSNKYFKKILNTLHNWRADELIIIANEVLTNNSSPDIAFLQGIISKLSLLQNKSKNSKTKTYQDIKNAIEVILNNKEQLLSSVNLKKLKRSSRAFISLIDIFDEYIKFEELYEKDFYEGDKIFSYHFYRERNKKISSLKKNLFISKHGSLFCEACKFNFHNCYGERGKDFAEVHHNIPISSDLFHGTTSLEDLTVLCSNCHRIVHRHNPWISLEELKQIINKNYAA